MLDPAAPLIWSFTFLKTYRDICAHQFYRQYILKDISYVETEAMRIGNEVHAAMEKRIGGKQPLPQHLGHLDPLCLAFDPFSTIRTEQKLAITREGKSCDYWARNCWGRGKLDVVIVNGTTGYLADHKTGKEREEPFELEVQAVLLKARYPQLKKIVGQYLWLKEIKVGELYDLSDTEGTWGEINRIMQQIESCQTQGLWEKRSSPLCKWCDVRDCEYNRKPA